MGKRGNMMKSLIVSKKAIMELPFGMIFAIFLVVVFIVVAIYAINYFLNLQRCSQIGIFVDDFQKSVDDLWKGQKGTDSFSAALPKSIEMICFANLSLPSSGEDAIYNQLKRNMAPEANLYIYPQKAGCGSPYKTIKHINITGLENPYCINNSERFEISLEKGFFDTLVRVG